ncbi:hypothetical protein [Luteolibacter soli]|uniref:DUF1772 domain-containing protein n=1 Tax=Luteolibacter soli TaxID=3135280 RepID=A0ABU9AX40_9BACT
MTKPQAISLALAGLTIALAAISAVIRSIAWAKLDALSAAHVPHTHPAVIAGFRILRIADASAWLMTLVAFLCGRLAFRHWHRAWQLYLFIALLIAAFIFAFFDHVLS